MWFKTRVGFCSLVTPFEIRVSYYPNARIPNYCVYARSNKDQDFHYEGRLGSAKATGPVTFLVMFLPSDTVQKGIAACMKVIEEAICTQDKICDLSAFGDESAWEGWNVIEWQ
jgi:hypothetical protein